MPASGTLLISTDIQQTNPIDLATPSSPLAYVKRLRFTSGTAVDQFDKVWSDTRTLAASGTESLDLAGVLTDAFGVAFTLARVKGVIVCAAAGNTNNVNVTQPASNGVPGLFLAASDGISVRPNGAFAWFAPDAVGAVVTAASGDLLTITNSAGGTGVTYDIVILGSSA